MDSSHVHVFAHRCGGRGGAFGKIVFFALGFLVASFINKRRRSRAVKPREDRDDTRSDSDEDQPDSQDGSEFRDIIDRVKNLERRYRRHQPSDESKPSTSDSTAPSASE